jgi:hypothetical protein
MAAEIALGHLLGLLMILGGAIGTGSFTETAANALVRINLHTAVSAAMMGLGGTCLDAGWISTVVAGDRHIVGKYSGYPRAALLDPVTAVYLMDAPIVTPHLQVMPVLARHHAGLASGTYLRVNKESVLFAHYDALVSTTRFITVSCITPFPPVP